MLAQVYLKRTVPIRLANGVTRLASPTGWASPPARASSARSAQLRQHLPDRRPPALRRRVGVPHGHGGCIVPHQVLDRPWGHPVGEEGRREGVPTRPRMDRYAPPTAVATASAACRSRLSSVWRYRSVTTLPGRCPEILPMVATSGGAHEGERSRRGSERARRRLGRATMATVEVSRRARHPRIRSWPVLPCSIGLWPPPMTFR